MKTWKVAVAILIAVVISFTGNILFNALTMAEPSEKSFKPSMQIQDPLKHLRIGVNPNTNNISMQIPFQGQGSLTVLYNRPNSTKTLQTRTITNANQSTHFALNRLQSDTTYTVEAILITKEGTIKQSDTWTVATRSR